MFQNDKKNRLTGTKATQHSQLDPQCRRLDSVKDGAVRRRGVERPGNQNLGTALYRMTRLFNLVASQLD